ncbi:amidohydrolase family protein [Luteimonas marina]|uniref:Amidohydrolase family protein n=1 Tax=Luteimonas marina TaxID=488485 RepID=A0A5C5UC72_9GAMM|nr:amidohydrolase family protein [Luteimonas marina]TWT23190.1 amidohydrolase family protein [Luteimonas marina]
MKRTFLLLLALALAAPVHAAQTLRYVALVDGGTKAGQQTVVQGDDGVTRVDFIFKDNGRGPELKEEFTLNADGTFRTYRVSGTSTFGAPVDESFEFADGVARWKSTSDAGEQRVAPGAQYSPLGGTPAVASVAMAALAARPDGRLPLIPSGTLSARKVAEAQVRKGDEARTVQLLAVTGVGFTPSFAWATDEARPRLFAFIFPGFVQLVEEGWEGNADALEALQKTAEGEALAALQQRLAHPLRGTTLIRGARVFDSEHARLGPASDVLLRDGRIVSVSAAGGETAGADHVIDADGRVLLPGLFDMHAHMDRWSGGLDIATGVTSVRDMGNDNATLQQVMAEERAGTLLMPRIVATGFLEGESQQSARNGFVVGDLDGAKEAIDWYAGHGYLQIKVYNSFPKEILAETVAYAHAKGLLVSGHVPVFLRAQDAIDAGYDEIQHINQLMLNFLVKPQTDTRTLERFYLPAREVAGLDLDSKPVQDFIATLARKQIVIDPTLATFEFLHQRNGEMSPIFAGIEAHVPPDVQRGRRVAEMDIPDDATGDLYRRSFARMVEFVGRAWRAGVPLVAGTDEVPGFTLQHELALYVRAGLTPAQALQVATWNGAKYSKVLDRLGSITPGKQADLLLVDGDPTTDIGDIRKVTTVIKGDTVYYPSEIFTELGIKPFAAPLRARPSGH